MNEDSDNNRETLVSVIVPIFKVEEYLRQCVASITSQSHKCLEVILVDDGSPDGSGSIADELAVEDARISVIHQANSGVSEARNAGLQKASGEYICFVDADDWISPDFVEKLLAHALTYDADMVLSRSVLTSARQEKSKSEVIEIWTPEQATAQLLYAEIIIGCWNKLYRRSLIDNHRMRFLPQFFMGEGLNFITMFSQRSSRIVVTDRRLYYYRRDNSESATTKISVAKMQNALGAIDYIRANLILKSRQVLLALDFHQWWTSFYAMHAARVTGTQVLQRQFYESCRAFVKGCAFRMLTKASISPRRRFITFLIWLSPSFALWLVERRLGT